jgi:hypothetical protein
VQELYARVIVVLTNFIIPDHFVSRRTGEATLRSVSVPQPPRTVQQQWLEAVKLKPIAGAFERGGSRIFSVASVSEPTVLKTAGL